MRNDTGASHFLFDGYSLDLNGGRLIRDGKDLQIRPKVFEFLHVLVEGRGRLFSKDELIETLWTNTIASEESLVQVVSNLRAVLGSDAAKIIVTVPKRGYRLGVSVEDNSQKPEFKKEYDVHYATSRDISIAYQVIGDGPVDLVYIPGWVSHLEYGWESPFLAEFYEGLAKHTRLILFDKRGTGLSDRAFGLPSTEQRMQDVRAVMDAAGSKRAAILAMSEGGGLAMSFAAAYPERVSALALYGVFAKREWSPEYPWAPTKDERQKFYDEIENGWGGPIGIDSIAPKYASDETFCKWWSTYQRRSASPAAALALAKMNTQVDVRQILADIKTPTLVMHRIEDREANIEEARYISTRIPNSKLLEMPGDEHVIFLGDKNAVIRATNEFVLANNKS